MRAIDIVRCGPILAAVLGLFFSGALMQASKPSKSITKTQLAEFSVMGIAARTSNAKEMTAQGVIGPQWERLIKEDLVQKIPNRADRNIIALYTDYASDKDGEYTFVLGAKVSSAADIPAGMIVKKVPQGRYAVLTSDRGPASRVVPAAWKQIWGLTKADLGGDRAYKSDFELNDERAADPQNSQVDIYVGIK